MWLNMKRLIGIILFLWLTQLFAQHPAQLSLSRCIDLAIRNSYRLQADSSQIRATEFTFRSERSSYYPTIVGELSHDQLIYSPYDFRQQWAGVRLDWASGNTLLHSAEAYRALIRAREEEREVARLKLMQRVSHLYFSILQQELNLQLLTTRKQLLEEHLQVSRALWQAGTRTELDVLQTRNALERLREEIVITEMERDTQQQEFVQLLNLPPDQPINLKPYRADPDSLSKSPLLRTPGNVEQFPSLVALGFRARFHQLQQRQVNATLFPEVQFHGGFQVDRDPTAEGNYWLVGIGLQFPLFQWGKSRFQRETFRAQATSLTYQQKQMHREIRIQAANLRHRLDKLLELYQLQNNRLAINQRAFQYARANYQAGLITNLDYLAAQQALIRNQLQLGQTRLAYLKSLIDYLILTGREQVIEQLN